MSSLLSTCLITCAGAFSARSKNEVMFPSNVVTEFQASTAGTSGGPRPMMAWNAALERADMLACWTVQKLWLASGNGPICTVSEDDAARQPPLPYACCDTRRPGLKVEL